MQDNENTSSHFVADFMLRFILFLHSDVNIHNDMIDGIAKTVQPIIQCSNRRTCTVDILEFITSTHEKVQASQRVAGLATNEYMFGC